MKQNLLRSLEKKNPILAFEFLTAESHERELSDLPIPQSETIALYVIGLGSQSWQEKILKWLEEDPNRKTYLIIDSPYYLSFLSINLLEHSQLQIGNNLLAYTWDHLYQPWELVGGSIEKEEELANAILGVELTFGLYRDFGVQELTNTMTNLLREKDAKDGSALRGKFYNIPAIICGAGPSLEKSLEELKKVGDRALIFGGGSALAPLARENIPIHFAVALDPAPPSERFFRQTYFETPLFYQNQVASSLLNCHHGAKLCIGESGSFCLEQWLTEDLMLPNSDVGWNVSTFATSIATLLGCNPIYFVGMDLSVSKEATYAKGVEGKDERKNPITLTDRFGNEVATRSDFLMGKKWLESFAENHDETRFINASKGGLSLDGIPFGALEVGTKSRDLFSKIHQEVSKAQQLNLGAFQEKLTKLDQSLRNVEKILGEYTEALSQERNVILYECELDEEVFYQSHLLPVWEVWKHFLQSDEIVRGMENPKLEKKLQEVVFYQQLTERFVHERSL